MAFLDAFGPAQRALFEAAAERLALPRGRYLLRRGDPGGDVFLVARGSLEVVDSRASPELILNTLPEGAVVGEMAFVDDSPRSADVRAGVDTEVLRWGRDDLRSLLDKHPDLGTAFYRRVAGLAAERIRSLTEGAVRGAFGTESAPVPEAEELGAWVDRIAAAVKDALPPIETALRRDPNDADAGARVREVLDQLEAEVDRLFAAQKEPGAAAFAASRLSRELHPYLVRSSLAERSIRRPQGVAGTAEILAHVLVDTPGGEGRLGELVDRWLLDRPTFRALRGIKGPLVEEVRRHLPKHRNRRALLVNVGTGSLVARMSEALAHPPTVLTVVDQSRDTLAMIDLGAAGVRGVELNPVLENLAAFALGRARHTLGNQDAVVVHGLLEYLPERIAVSLLETCRELLSPDGVVVLATLGPSPDRALVDRLLNWPTLRRGPEGLGLLLAAAGLETTAHPWLEPPADLRVAIPAERTRITRRPRLPDEETTTG